MIAKFHSWMLRLGNWFCGLIIIRFTYLVFVAANGSQDYSSSLATCFSEYSAHVAA